MQRNRGFSLIELLIVVAIILIIAGIAIPNLLRAKISANESSAAGSVREVTTGEISYASAYPSIGYTSLATLGGAAPCMPSSTPACFIDTVLAQGTKSGYLVNGVGIGGTPNTTFVTGAIPANYGVTGIRDFCITTDGVLHINPGSAGATLPTDVNTCTSYAIAD